MVDISAALNPRQRDVLRWIAAGCPDGVMTDFTYKTTALALQGRRLVTVSKRRGVWSATLTDAGRFYLAHGHHPPDDTARRTRPTHERSPSRAPINSQRPKGEAPSAATPGDKPASEPSAAPPDKKAAAVKLPRAGPRRGPVDQLIADLQQARGVLRVPRPTYVAGKAQGTDYTQLVLAAQRHGKVPAGQRLLTRDLRWPDMEIRLEPAIPGTDVPRPPVPVPSRVVRYHRVVVQFRDHPKRHEISKAHLPRALRLLQALVVEAERRGHSVALVDEPAGPYARRWAGSRDGHVAITVGGYTHALRILEIGMPSRGHWEMTHYRSRESYGALTGSGKLRIEVAGYGGSEGRVYRWSDTSRAPLEDRLADVLAEVEIRAAEDAHRDRERRRREEERQRAREQAIAEATAKLVEADRARHLEDQIHRWDLVTRGRAYLAALRDTIAARAATADTAGENEVIEGAYQWLRWAEDYLTNIDPLRGPLAMPSPPPATPEALKPFLPPPLSPW